MHRTTIPEFFDWFARTQDASRPFLVVGKGPSFSQWRSEYYTEYVVVALNDVIGKIPCHIGHVIDAEVIWRLFADRFAKRMMFFEGCPKIVLPWHPHFGCRPITHRTLELLCNTEAPFFTISNFRRLAWYNCSTWKGTPYGDSPVVRVRHFSAEAAIRLLAMAGVKTIRTLGLDGGTEYAKEFSHLKPLMNGRANFDPQFREIAKTVKQYGLDLKAVE